MATARKPKEPLLIAEVAWQADDIQKFRPKWSVTKCNEWLDANEDSIQEAMIATGWTIIESLLAGGEVK